MLAVERCSGMENGSNFRFDLVDFRTVKNIVRFPMDEGINWPMIMVMIAPNKI